MQPNISVNIIYLYPRPVSKQERWSKGREHGEDSTFLAWLEGQPLIKVGSSQVFDSSQS